MVTAIVLINTEVGRAPTVAQALVEMDEVVEVYSVAGEYDIVAIVRAAEYERMADVIPAKLSSVEGISRTRTLMAFRRYSDSLLERMWEIGFKEEQED